MESSRRDLYFEGACQLVLGSLAELGSGGRKGTALRKTWVRDTHLERRENDRLTVTLTVTLPGLHMHLLL